MNMIEKRRAMAGQGGFTLIELLVVVAILAILAGAAIIGIGAMRSNAQKQVCNTDQQTLQTAAEAWALDQNTSALTAPQATLTGNGYLKTGVPTFGDPARTTATSPFVATATAGGKCA
ncbi:MAG: prepilin-type N-terminal cleavage/methylation domain-containing protein [Actinobacteria bacterium]|nr:prepilin-type N-terminal cleavage/methylation domain-containing protein [Actinomycetota bacterium]